MICIKPTSKNLASVKCLDAVKEGGQTDREAYFDFDRRPRGPPWIFVLVQERFFCKTHNILLIKKKRFIRGFLFTSNPFRKCGFG